MTKIPIKEGLTPTGTLSENQRDLLNLIRLHQPVRRSALTDMTSLTQQSVHRILSSLEDMGLIQTAPGEASGPGKPSPNLNLVDRARFGLGILLNTDSVVLSVVGLKCEPLAGRSFAIDASDRTRALDVIHEAALDMLEEHEIPQDALCGVGFTLPGFFVEAHSLFNAPELLRDWSLVDLRPELEARFGLPVTLENSANAGAIGETLGEIGKRYHNFVYLGFDYGFGGAIVIDGRLHAGRAGNAGELSAIWMDDEIKHRPAMGLLLEHLRARGVELSGIDQLRREFDPNWPGVEDWVRQTLPQLNRLIFGLTGIVDPEAIVFGGQIAPELARILIERVSFPSKFRYDHPPPLPDLVMGSTVENPAASGVAQLPLKHTYFR